MTEVELLPESKEQILNHYREFSTFTNPGLYKDKLRDVLPDDIRKIGQLVRASIIHRTTLAVGNTGTNADLRFGDMNRIPWYRQAEDDVLVTAPAMLAELYRRDPRGFVLDRKPEDKLVLTCRYVSILMAAILKSKGIPTRVRSGNTSYFDMGDLGEVSTDHWINQYWDSGRSRWVTIDVDGSLSMKNQNYDPYDMPESAFDFPADVWLKLRSGEDDPNRFWNAGGVRGSIVVLWSLFYDFHSLMNNEIIYLHGPVYGTKERFSKLTQKELESIDNLARLMQSPDKNFDELKQIWETNKDFRILYGALLDGPERKG